MEPLVAPRPITHGPRAHNHEYPTCRTWLDTRRVLVEATGADIRGVALCAVDCETGRSETLWQSESAAIGYYLADYAPAVQCLVVLDPDCHRIHLCNLRSGRHGCVFVEAEYTMAGPPTIASDGTRIAWWAMAPAIASRHFDNYSTIIFALDVDPLRCVATGEPRIVDVYPRRRLTGGNSRQGIHINHPQINPTDKDHLCFSHEMLGAEPDGSVAMCRLWQARVDESDKRPLVRQPAGLHFTHEVIAPDGRSLWFAYMHGVGQVEFASGVCRSLYYNPQCCPGHVTISPDQRWVAGDTWNDWKDKQGRAVQSLMLLEPATRRWAHLCWFPRCRGHPSHPHPNFCPDGRKIAFTFLDEQGICQVAVVDAGPVMDRWEELAQGIADRASPHWLATLGT